MNTRVGTKLLYVSALLNTPAGKRHEGMINDFIREVENEMYGNQIDELKASAYNIGLPSKSKDIQ